MAYKSNVRELPDLARHLIAYRRADHVEFRYTFDVPHLPPAFRASEFLDAAEWTWLADAVADLPAERVRVQRPPPTEVTAEPRTARGPAAMLPGRAMFRLSWDDTLDVVGVLAAGRHDEALEDTILKTNIRDIADPQRFFDEALAAPRCQDRF